jgi:hypothetical protein
VAPIIHGPALVFFFSRRLGNCGGHRDQASPGPGTHHFCCLASKLLRSYAVKSHKRERSRFTLIKLRGSGPTQRSYSLLACLLLPYHWTGSVTEGSANRTHPFGSTTGTAACLPSQRIAPSIALLPLLQIRSLKPQKRDAYGPAYQH